MYKFSNFILIAFYFSDKLQAVRIYIGIYRGILYVLFGLLYDKYKYQGRSNETFLWLKRHSFFQSETSHVSIFFAQHKIPRTFYGNLGARYQFRKLKGERSWFECSRKRVIGFKF